MKTKRCLIIMATVLLVILSSVRIETQAIYEIYLPFLAEKNECGCEVEMGLWSYIAPESTVNNCLNPSAELAANFVAVAGGTMTRVTTSSFFGVRAYRIQTAANDEGGSVTLDALANAIHYVAVRVRGTLPASWDWSLDNAAYTAPVELLDYDGDWALYGLQFPAAQANGSTTFYMRQNGAGVGDFNVDAIQVEEKTSWTTYCDGSRPGCEWLGAEDASQSQRGTLSRAGGTVIDFADLDFDVSGFVGAGKSPITLNVDNYALLPGGELNSQKTNVRSFTLTGWIQGTSIEDLHANRQALIDAVSINQTPENQPVILRYTGASVVKEIKAYYQAGLEGKITARFECLEQRVALRFLATSPNFQEVSESTGILDTTDTLTLRYVMGRLRSTGQWDDLGVAANPTGGGEVYAVLYASNGIVYFGGDFTGFDTNAGWDYIVSYNPFTDTWARVGGASDFTDIIRALAEGPDGIVYAGGDFQNAAGVADFIAQWNGAAWLAVGNPVQGVANIAGVYSLAFGNSGNLYVAGDFTSWANVANADYITVWNGAAYAALGIPVQGAAAINRVQAVATDSQENVYIGGLFSDWANVAAADIIVMWNASSAAYEALDVGLTNSVTSIEIRDDSTVYLGGGFTNAGGNADGDFVCVWNGTAFLPLSIGTIGGVLGLGLAPDGVLYVAGQFLQAGGLSVRYIAKWNGASFANLDVGITITAALRGFAFGPPDPVVNRNYDVYIGYDNSVATQRAGIATVTNGGTESAYPKIIISRTGGTAANLTNIRNETLGLELLFEYDLLDGETLTIDLSPTNKSIVSSFFGSRLDALLPNSDFGTWRLQPGDNDITCYINDGGAPTMGAFVVFQDQFWSAD